MEASLPPLGILAAGAQHGVASELRTRRLNGMKTDTAVAHISSAVRGGGGGGGLVRMHEKKGRGHWTFQNKSGLKSSSLSRDLCLVSGLICHVSGGKRKDDLSTAHK